LQQVSDAAFHSHEEHAHHLDEDEEGGRPPSDDWLTVVLEEYRSLRREIVASLAMQQSSLTLGTLALGGLVLAGFHDWDTKTANLPLVIFFVVVPIVSYVVGFIWLGEYARATRAGEYLVHVEERVNEALRKPALGWERWLREPGTDGCTRQYAWNIWAIFVYFVVAVPVGSVVAANFSGRGRELDSAERLGFDLGEAALFAIVFWFLDRYFAESRRAAGAVRTRVAVDAATATTPAGP
jgi:hypothetical protein